MSYSCRAATQSNQLLLARLSSAATTSLNGVDVANKDLLSSIKREFFSIAGDMFSISNFMIVTCHGELRDLKGGHYHKIAEISENAEKCLELEYRVDEPSCSTPRRRVINLPSVTPIEALKTPAFEELASKEGNGEARKLPEAFEPPQAQPLRDSRAPLTTIN